MKNISKFEPNENFIFVFENGKAVRIPSNAYETKGNRRKLTGAYSAVSPLVAVFYEETPKNILRKSRNGQSR